MKVSVKTPCRLHLTLIDLNGSLGRIDGGVGVALEEPSVVVEAEKSSAFKVDASKRREELTRLCERIAEKYQLEEKFTLTVKKQIPVHSGLGSTTQLYLATAKAILELNNLHVPTSELAFQTGRGGTSGIGVAAFERGGFIVDCGHSFGTGKDKKSFLPSSYSKAKPPPVACRLDFPEWNVVLCIPEGRGLHGVDELKYFEHHFPAREREPEKISRLILMKLIPSIIEKNIGEFDASIKLINKTRSFQFPKETARLIREVNQSGGRGTSMSSFGPAVFTFTDNKEDLEKIREKLGHCGVVVETKAQNYGAAVKKM